MIELVQHLTKPGSAVNLAQQLEGLVREGRIGPETLLPPVRDLARALHVSPGTAAAAYKALRAQGVVHTDGRRGTRVLPRPARREYAETPAPPGTVDLQVANPDPRLLPGLRRIFAGVRAESDAYGGLHLDEDLLRRMRGGFHADGVDATHLVVTGGAIGAIYRALRACLSAGEKVAVEDPGFNEHHASVRAHAMFPVPVAIDEQGMLPAALSAALRGGARAVIVTPRFQSPTGAALGKGRAAELRAVLIGHPEAAVLVDDYASLLADVPYFDIVKGRSRWLVVRSFNKPVAPDLRVAVAAADAETADRLRREQWLSDGWISGYLQRAAAAALASRSAQSLMARARKTYSSRRTMLLRALAARGVEARGASGLNVWVPVADEAEAARGLLERGWCVRAGARYRLRSAPAIRITIARLMPEQSDRLADDVRAVLGPGLGGRGP
jgi:DNA-binding transcriptional MocR family regulator